MKKVIITACVFFSINTAFAQNTSFNEKANAYIKEYAGWAIEEQQRVGIPASITLAQGIYETGAGASELATEANNHFGIKCKKEWKGMTYKYTDDAPNECFRKYSSAKESYIDHSDYLKNSPRYAELFTFPVENYTQWAKGLRRCGYATNPAYAQKLIKMVEDFDLHQFTLAAQMVSAPVPKKEYVSVTQKVQSIQEHDAALVPIKMPARIDTTTSTINNTEEKEASVAKDGTIRINDLRAVLGKKGDLPLEIAMNHNFRYARLLEINELEDAPLPADMPVFLESKKYKGAHETHIVAEGETVESIAQNEGMGSRQLRIFNLMAHNEQPIVGATLKLQSQSDERPETYRMSKVVTEKKQDRFTLQENKKNQESDFLPTKKSIQSANAEEVEIGYGAERPAFLKEQKAEEKSININTELVPAKQMPVAADEKQVSAEVPVMDELALLKARLDKAVYSQGSKSNVKVTSSDAAAINKAQIKNVNVAEAPEKQANVVAEKYHIVEKGDTGYSIAQKYGIKVKQLNEWNKLNFEAIKVGQKLRVK